MTVVGLSDNESDILLIVNTAFAVWPPPEAEIVLEVEVETTTVVTVNVALVAPAETVTVAGTVAAAVLLDVRVTDIPPAGAAPLSVTVPVEGDPPATVDGFNETTETVVGLIVRVAVCEDAVIVAVATEVTPAVDTVKVPVV